MKQILPMVAELDNSVTHYIAAQAAWQNAGSVSDRHEVTTNEANTYVISPTSATIKHLYIRLSAAPGSGKSWTFTVRKNNADTAVVATVSDLATSGNSASASVTVTTGDTFDIKVTSSGTPTNSIVTFTLQYETQQAGQSIISGGSRDFTASPGYAALGFYEPRNMTAPSFDDLHSTAPYTFDIKTGYAVCDVAPGIGKTRRVRILSEGTTTIADIDITGANTTGSVTINYSSFATERLNVEFYELTGPAAITSIRYTLLLESTTMDEGVNFSWLLMSGGVTDNNDGYLSATQSSILLDGSPATERKIYCGPTAFKLHDLYVWGDPLDIADSRYFVVRKNGVDTGLDPEIGGGSGEAMDTFGNVDLAEGDYFSLYVDHTGSSSSGASRAGMVMEVPVATPKGLPILFAG